MAIQPGGVIGRYQILAQLGQGGMATVYKAFQPSLDRTVALKVMRAGLSEDTEFRERFQREAKAIARLIHPNIVQVFDFDEVDGRSFMTMQFIEGGTLKDKLEELSKNGERLPPREIARIISQVADALAFAHGLGIVHRDVKPSNVMLTNDGKAVVSDFGIAKILTGTQYTQAGVGIGTPEYMSPEQGQGKTVDARSDLYSLGVMAYELLAGKLPFAADTPLAVVLMHVRDPLPLPSSVDPRIGSATERVILRALAKDPSERYGSVQAFAAALQAAISEDETGTARTAVVVGAADAASTLRVAGPAATVPPPVAPAASPLAQRPVQIAAAVVVLLLIGGVAFALTRGGPTTAPAPAKTAAGTAVAATVAPAAAATAAAATAAAPAQPAAAPAPSIVPGKGQLVYQLDPRNPRAGPVRIQTANSQDQVTTVGDAVQIDVSPNSHVEIMVNQPLQDIVIDASVKYVSGDGGYQLIVRVGQGGADVVQIDPASGSVAILRQPAGGQGQPQQLAAPKPGLPAGPGQTQTVTASAIGQTISVLSGSTEVNRAQDPAPPQGGVVFGASSGGQTRFVIQIASLRVYDARSR